MKAKILSLFDGMACGMLAMMAAGVEVESYDAYEIDKYAVKTATHNFQMIEQHGDVFAEDFTKYDGVDFLVGGSPCTYWSIAQTKNRETVASGLGWELFSQYVRALHEAKPKYFIYENNKSMSKEIRASIDEAFGFEAVCINSALVSAQNRQRLYWVGKRNADGTYSKVNVEQPEDRGILLKDVLDGAVAWKEKAYTLDASYWKTTGQYNPENQCARRLMAAEPVNITADGKSQTIKAQYQQTSPANICCYTSTYGASCVAEPVQVGRMPREDGIVTDSKQYRVYDVDGKAVTQCGQGGGLGAKTGLYALPVDEPKCYAVPCEWDENGEPTKAVSRSDGKTYPVYKVENGQITIKDKQYPIKLLDGYYIIRKLTVSECMRLQTVPEWYDFSCVSNSQAYKMLGNGWTVEVIAHLIRSALNFGL